MAFALTWSVKFGGVAGLTDITSFVLDLEIDSAAEIGQCGRSRATITLNNTGGQFTPRGSGTYASTDWLSQALVISTDTPTSADLAFVGMVSHVEVNHVNAKESTVVIEGLDILTLAGSTPAFAPSALGASQTIAAFLDGVFDNLGGIPGYRAINLPKLGSGNNSIVDGITVTLPANAATLDTTTLPSGQRVSDWLNTSIFPSGPATAYVTGYGISFGQWIWYVYVVDRDLNKTSAYAQTFTFVDGSSALTSGQMPIEGLHVGFQVDDLINSATIDDVGVGVAASVTDTTSVNLYGQRGYSATQTVPSTQAVLDYAAQFWGNRYGTVRYLTDGIQLTFSQVRSRAVDNTVANAAFARLCAQTVLWQRAAITYRAPGMSSSVTDQVVIVGRKVMASPSDTRVELTLKSGQDNQSFELDSSTYGILDTNRLG